VLHQKREEEEENTAGVPYTPTIFAVSMSLSLCHVEKGGSCGCHVASEKKKQKKKAGVHFTPVVCLVYGLPPSIVVKRKREGSWLVVVAVKLI